MITTHVIPKVAGKALIAGAVALVGLGLASGTAQAFDPQPEPPGTEVGFNPQPEPPVKRVGFDPQPDPPGTVKVGIIRR